MRGRWASAAIGAGVARNRAGREMEAQNQANQQQIDQLNAQHQKEMEQMQQQYSQQAQPKQSSGQEDITQKLQKLADLHKQGILSDEEFQKMKADLIAKM